MRIAVNLAQRKQAGFVAGTRGGAGGLTSFTSATRFGDIKVNVEDLKELPLLKIFSAIGLGIIINAYAESYKNDLIEVENVKMDGLRKEVAVIKKKEGELREFERKRKSLEQDEQIIISKIQTINKLVEARKFSIETLLFLSKSMPEDLWLKDFSIDKSALIINGESLSAESVYQLISKLNDGTFFEQVEPAAIRSSILNIPTGELETTAFSIKAKQILKGVE